VGRASTIPEAGTELVMSFVHSGPETPTIDESTWRVQEIKEMTAAIEQKKPGTASPRFRDYYSRELWHAADEHTYHHDYDGAIGYYRKQIRYWDGLGRPENIEIVRAHEHIGKLLTDQGKSDLAVAELQTALAKITTQKLTWPSAVRSSGSRRRRQGQGAQEPRRGASPKG
jgi:hypothetical protein